MVDVLYTTAQEDVQWLPEDPERPRSSVVQPDSVGTPTPGYRPMSDTDKFNTDTSEVTENGKADENGELTAGNSNHSNYQIASVRSDESA